jgi:DNA mismatch repair protein MutS
MNKMREQFEAVKSAHNSAVLLFRLGDRYEAFYEDARTVTRECDYQPDRPFGDIERVSVAAGQAQIAINRLRNRGYKVSIVEEREL